MIYITFRNWLSVVISVICMLLMGFSTPIRLHADEVTIGTWNIRMLSAQSRNGSERSQIADLLQAYDLVALQEVRDDSVVAILVDTLRARGVDADWAQGPSQGVPPADERYAFIYRRDRVQLGQSQVWPDAAGAFVRPACWVRFQSGTFDGILATVHLVYGESVSERKAEAAALPDMLTGIAADAPDELDVILAGDFNLGPDTVGDLGLSSRLEPLFAPGTGTTIAGNDLDNIWVSPTHTTEYTGDSGVTKFDETIYAGDDTQASLEVSDHRPLWAHFRIDTRDDDGPVGTVITGCGWGQAKSPTGK